MIDLYANNGQQLAANSVSVIAAANDLARLRDLAEIAPTVGFFTAASVVDLLAASIDNKHTIYALTVQGGQGAVACDVTIRSDSTVLAVVSVSGPADGLALQLPKPLRGGVGEAITVQLSTASNVTVQAYSCLEDAATGVPIPANALTDLDGEILTYP